MYTEAVSPLLDLWYYLQRRIRATVKLSLISTSVTFTQTARHSIAVWFPHWEGSVNGAIVSEIHWRCTHLALAQQILNTCSGAENCLLSLLFWTTAPERLISSVSCNDCIWRQTTSGNGLNLVHPSHGGVRSWEVLILLWGQEVVKLFIQPSKYVRKKTNNNFSFQTKMESFWFLCLILNVWNNIAIVSNVIRWRPLLTVKHSAK